jgi:sulfur carrier protein ThiS
MAVRVELSLLLRKYVSDYDDDDGILIDHKEGKTVKHVINELGIPKEKVFTVLVNRKPSNVGHILQDGDHVRLSMILGAG